MNSIKINGHSYPVLYKSLPNITSIVQKMSKESIKKQTKQPVLANALLEEEINFLASKFQDIIIKIASEQSRETHPSDKSMNPQPDSKAIKSEIAMQLKSFNERIQNKIVTLQQDIKNQQIKYNQLEEQLKQQKANSQKEINARSEIIRREESLFNQNKCLIEDNEKLRNKKNELKAEISKKNQMIDNLTQKVDQISIEYNELFAKVNKEKREQKEQLKKQLTKVKAELLQSNEAQTFLKDKINELTKNIDFLNAENDALKVETEANKSDLNKLLEEKINNEKNINLLKEKNQKLISAYKSAETNIQHLKTENDSLNVENEANKSNLEKLLEEKANNEKSINLLKGENQNLKSAFDSAEAEKLNLMQNIEAITEKLTEQIQLVSEEKAMISELQVKRDEEIEKFKQLQNEIEQNHEKELQEIKNLLDEKQNEIANQSQKLAENEEIISNLMKEKEESEKANIDLQMNNENINEKYKALEKSSNSEKEQLKAEILQLQESCQMMKQKINDFEIAENNKNIVKKIFNRQVFADKDIQQYPDEEVFIPQEYSQKSIQVIDYYDDILPTITFHFNKSPEEFGYDFFNQILNESSEGNAVIINVEKGSTIVKVALALFIKQENIIQQKLGKIVASIKEKINSPLGKSVIGNLVDEPIIKIPDNQKIKELCAKPSLNLLQNTQELNEKINVDEIKKDVIKIARENMANDAYNWKYIFSHQTLYDQLEKQIRADIENNQYEMIMIDYALIANKFIDDEYEKIKKKIPSKDVKECFLYHGSRLNNHQKIIKQHFLMPGQDKMEKQLDDGYYGKGVYATENIFYASIYSNGYRKLKVNERAYVLCCRAIYNKKMVKELTNLSYYGKELDDEIKDNYGINHAFVGDCNGFHPIEKSKIEKCHIYGHEFVFSNKFQLVPLCSFTVMRKDHCIIWKDENIENNENSGYMKELSKKMEINIYFKKSVDDALKMIKKKKRSKIKLITNGGANLSGKTLIEKARQIVGSNFVCLVFASSPDHIKWVSAMENVLFTKSPADFRDFSKLKMEKNDILNFVHKLEEKNKYKFKINKSKLLEFPYAND